MSSVHQTGLVSLFVHGSSDEYIVAHLIVVNIISPFLRVRDLILYAAVLSFSRPAPSNSLVYANTVLVISTALSLAHTPLL